jgi:hypothetical protein
MGDVLGKPQQVGISKNVMIDAEGGEGVEGNHPKESRDSGIMGELADVISLVDPEVLIRAAASA